MSLLRLFRSKSANAPGVVPGDFAHYVFVDFENVQDVDLDLIEGRPVHVTLLIGSKQSKIPTELSMQMHNFSGQVLPVRLDASGRNALDLTLASYLGRTLERAAAGATFAIVSRDRDFDPMIDHWQSAGIDVSRVPAFASLPCLGATRRAPASRSRAPAAEERAPSSGRAPGHGSGRGGSARAVPVERLARILLDPTTRGRPSTRARLEGFIRNRLGANPTDGDVQDVLDHLVASGILSVGSQGRVTYARAE